ncbi:MAG: acyl-CoA dehydrogenase, partial [Rhodospirillaceae bacterium]|nr:acyl-CoA dehydrogenase [Rhodospirillaceae bacterium]
MPDRSFLDWPFFEPAHRELAPALDAWAKDNLHDIDESDVDAACRELVRRLAEGKWLDHCVPAAFGGVNEKLDVRSLCLIRETLARHSGLADFAFAMQGLGSGAISLKGSAEIQREFLPAVRSGQKIAAFALSEPEAGSDVAAMATTAVRDGNGWRIDGEKTWISNGGIADYYTVFARTGEAPGARGLSAFVVDAATPGLDIAERIDVIAPHPLARLTFDNCQVPADRILGAPGEGFKVAMATL